MDEIRTERLVWRTSRPDDLDGMFTLISDYEVVKWTSSWPYPPDRDFTASRCVPVDPLTGFAGPILLDGQIIGGMGIVTGELGFCIARAHWGNGYASEIGTAIVARHFRDFEADILRASVWQGNDASARVLEKLGFAQVGTSTQACVSRAMDMAARDFTLRRADWLAANPYVLRTDRLIIRGLRDDDWCELQRIGGVADVARNMRNITTPWADADVKSWLHISKWQGKLGFRPAVTLHDGTLIGVLGVGGDPTGCAYFLGKEHWGQGFATEAMAAFLADVFARFGIHFIHASHFIDNPASGGVLQKLGFESAGQDMGNSAARLEPAPELLYRLTRQRFGASR